MNRQDTRPRGYKTFYMLNSAEHEIFPAHKCYIAITCLHFNNYEQEKSHTVIVDFGCGQYKQPGEGWAPSG